MEITRTSPLTGRVNTMELDITPEQLAEFLGTGRRRLIQEIFPNLTREEREFVKTGYTQADWDHMFAGMEE